MHFCIVFTKRKKSWVKPKEAEKNLVKAVIFLPAFRRTQKNKIKIVLKNNQTKDEKAEWKNNFFTTIYL